MYKKKKKGKKEKNQKKELCVYPSSESHVNPTFPL